MSFRIEQYDGDDVIYIALDPDGAWAASEFPTELVTLDYNAQGGLIGIELVGSAAQSAGEALLSSVLRSDATGEIKDKLAPIVN